MKKLLSIIAAIGLTATTSATVIACGTTSNNSTDSESKNEGIVKTDVEIETSTTEVDVTDGNPKSFDILNYKDLLEVDVQGIDGVEVQYNPENGHVTVNSSVDDPTGIVINARNARKSVLVPVNNGPARDTAGSIELNTANVKMNLYEENKKTSNVEIENYKELKHVVVRQLSNSPFKFNFDKEKGIVKLDALAKGNGTLIIAAANAPTAIVQVTVEGKKNVDTIKIENENSILDENNNIKLNLDKNKNQKIKIENFNELENLDVLVGQGNVLTLNKETLKNDGSFIIEAKTTGVTTIIISADNVDKGPRALGIEVSNKESVDPEGPIDPEDPTNPDYSGIKTDKDHLDLKSNVDGNTENIKGEIKITNVKELDNPFITLSNKDVVDASLNSENGIISISVKKGAKDTHVGMMITAANSTVPRLIDIKIGTPSEEKNKQIQLNKHELTLDLNKNIKDNISIQNKDINELGKIKLVSSDENLVDAKVIDNKIEINSKEKAGTGSIIVIAENAEKFEIINLKVEPKAEVLPPKPEDPEDPENPNNPEKSGIKIDKNYVELSIQDEEKPVDPEDPETFKDEEKPVDPETTPKSDVVTIKNYNDLENVELTIVNENIIEASLKKDGKIEIKSKKEDGKATIIISAENTKKPRILNVVINKGKTSVDPEKPVDPENPTNPENSGIKVDKKKVTLNLVDRTNDIVKIENYKDLLNPSIMVVHDGIVKNDIKIDEKTGNFKIEAQAYGNATIIISASNSTISRYVEVTVEPGKPDVKEGIKVDKEQVTLNIGQKDTDTITIGNYKELVKLRIDNKVSDSILAPEIKEGKIELKANKIGNATIVLNADNVDTVKIIDIKVESKKQVNDIVTNMESMDIKYKETKDIKIENFNELEGVKVISKDSNITSKFDEKTGLIHVTANQKTGNATIVISAANSFNTKVISINITGQKDTEIKLDPKSEPIVKDGLKMMVGEMNQEIKIANYEDLDDVKIEFSNIEEDNLRKNEVEYQISSDGTVTIKALKEKEQGINIKISAKNAKNQINIKLIIFPSADQEIETNTDELRVATNNEGKIAIENYNYILDIKVTFDSAEIADVWYEDGTDYIHVVAFDKIGEGKITITAKGQFNKLLTKTIKLTIYS